MTQAQIFTWWGEKAPNGWHTTFNLLHAIRNFDTNFMVLAHFRDVSGIEIVTCGLKATAALHKRAHVVFYLSFCPRRKKLMTMVIVCSTARIACHVARRTPFYSWHHGIHWFSSAASWMVRDCHNQERAGSQISNKLVDYSQSRTARCSFSDPEQSS